MTVASALVARVSAHIKMVNCSDTLEQSHYKFWTEHYHLNEKLHRLARMHNANTCTSGDDDQHTILDLMLKAASICLHEALIANAKKTTQVNQIRGSQVRASNSIALQQAVDISQCCRSRLSSDPVKASIHLPWSIYVALQSLLRRQTRSDLASTPSLTSASSSRSSTSDALPTLNNNWASESPPPNDSITTVGGCEDAGSVDWLTDALVMDAINTLRSTLIQLGQTSPLVNFFLKEIDLEFEGQAMVLNERMVGLVDFATSLF
ncbi:MAG: hypothetical protein Q9227_003250 [Pyrenula ochraceoflavens]